VLAPTYTSSSGETEITSPSSPHGQLVECHELLAKDGALERSQLLARVETEALGEERACAVVRRERLGLALGVVEREHELAPQPLAERLLGDETLQLGDERSVAAERQLRIDSLPRARRRIHCSVHSIGAARKRPSPVLIVCSMCFAVRVLPAR
jgi:hypothetical protein